MVRYRYYIVNYSNITKPFYYDYGFFVERRAKEVLANFFKGKYYTVIREDILFRFNIPKRKFKKTLAITPEERFFLKGKTIHRKVLRESFKVNNLRLYKFREYWDTPKDLGVERRRNPEKPYRVLLKR